MIKYQNWPACVNAASVAQYKTMLNTQEAAEGRMAHNNDRSEWNGIKHIEIMFDTIPLFPL
jgi:hypothetical protein